MSANINLRSMFQPKKVNVNGSVTKEFQAVQEVFENQFKNGDELSAQVCMYHKGQKVVDLWASSYDSSYTENTLQTVWSSTKNLTALCLASLVDRGLLKYTDKVSDHWAEFGVNGKEEITIADVMRHEGGLPYFTQQLHIEDSFMENIPSNGVGRVIETEKPIFPEGASKREYHAITRGFIAQEVFRRVEPKGRSIGQFLKEEITDALGADVFIGMKEEEQLEHVIVDVEQHLDMEVEEAAKSAGREDILEILEKYRQYLGEVEGKRPDHKDTFVHMSSTGHAGNTSSVAFWNSVATRRAEIPSAGGLASARGLALLAAVLANGGVWGGKTFLGELGWGQMHSSATQGETFGMKTFYTQGGVNHYLDGLTSSNSQPLAGSDGFIHYGQRVPREMYGWGGYGGSLFLWDPQNQVGFSYVPTYLAWWDKEKKRGTSLLNECYKCLKSLGINSS